MTAAPLDIVAVVAQLCNAFCAGDYDVFDRLVGNRGSSANEVAGALRAAGIYMWQAPPDEAWYGEEIESVMRDDGTWSFSVPVWSEGVKTGARLRFTVKDVFGDDEFWEPWVAAVET